MSGVHLLLQFCPHYNFLQWNDVQCVLCNLKHKCNLYWSSGTLSFPKTLIYSFTKCYIIKTNIGWKIDQFMHLINVCANLRVS